MFNNGTQNTGIDSRNGEGHLRRQEGGGCERGSGPQSICGSFYTVA